MENETLLDKCHDLVRIQNGSILQHCQLCIEPFYHPGSSDSAQYLLLVAVANSEELLHGFQQRTQTGFRLKTIKQAEGQSGKQEITKRKCLPKKLKVKWLHSGFWH